jgi:hypothetical protein
MQHRIDLLGEEPDALKSLNPLMAVIYLFAVAFTVTAFLH